jgi:hypothetical protein
LEIPDECFEDNGVREHMKQWFKGMRKGGEMTPTNLLRKYEGKLTLLKKFAYKFPGFGNLSKLPSGMAQRQQLRRPFVAKLWAEHNLVRILSNFTVTPQFQLAHNDNSPYRTGLA